LHDTGASAELQEDQQWTVIVFECAEISVGLLAAGPLDMQDAIDFTIDSSTLRSTGVAGSAILKGRTTLVLDLLELARSARPDLFAQALPSGTTAGALAARNERSTVLVAEDSDFFRSQIQQLIEAVGYRVIAAPDGQAAWDMLQQHASEVALVTTDVEMPGMDGLELARHIRADGRFDKLPIIALSSLAGEEEIARGIEAGIDQYQIKLNPEELVGAIRKMTGSFKSGEMKK
jgi:two-component system chemotaxis sensor kinase CheA